MFQNASWQNTFPATPSTSQEGTRLTAHATAHTKGAWTTLLTTAYDTYGFDMGCSGSVSAATQTDMMLDLAWGPNQENIIVREWPCGWRGLIAVGLIMQYFPIFIPKGELVSARIQSLITVDTVDVIFNSREGGSGEPPPLFSICDPYGTVVASSQGTSHTPGNTGTESTAANIGSTLSTDYGAVMLNVHGALTQTVVSNLTYHWELVIGSLTICEWITNSTTNESIMPCVPAVPFFKSLPAGAQLKVRAECSGTAQPQDVAFFCFR